MKRKISFVTNSSSTGFIIFIPSNVNVEKVVEENWQEISNDYDVKKEDVIADIKSLKDYSTFNIMDHSMIEEICGILGFYIKDIDDEDSVINIANHKTEKQIKNLLEME
jgi:hypothetical protein